MSTAQRQQTSRSSGLSSIDFFWVVGMDFRPIRRIGAPCGCDPDKHVFVGNGLRTHGMLAASLDKLLNTEHFRADEA